MAASYRLWRLSSAVLTPTSAGRRDEMGAVMRAIKDNPEQDQRLYRLLAVNSMVVARLCSEQIDGRHPVHQAPAAQDLPVPKAGGPYL